jgi:putative endopeptidase
MQNRTSSRADGRRRRTGYLFRESHCMRTGQMFTSKPRRHRHVVAARLVLQLAFIFFTAASTALAQAPPASQSAEEKPVAPPIVKGLDLSAIDKTADPCADFYQYACGNWIKDNPLPADQVRWVRSFSLLKERNLYQLWRLLDAAAREPSTPLQKQYGDYFAGCMNVSLLESKGLQPLEPALKRISELQDTRGVAELMGDLAASGEPAPPFDLDVEPDPGDSSRQILSISQGGLTLPSRDLYLGTRGFVRKRYVIHMVHVFMLAGDTMERAETEAQAVLNVEMSLAQASTGRADASHPGKRDHSLTFADLQKLAPGFDFATYFKHLTAAPVETLNVADPDFLKAVDGLLASVPVDAWRSYFRWHVFGEQAEALPKAFRDEDFSFWGSFFTRQEQPEPRWKECTEMTDRALGDSLGQDWVRQNFSPGARTGMEKLVAALEKALGDEISAVPWMSDATKKLAEEKLALIRNKIGNPERWHDYSSLKVDRNDLIGNLQRSRVFERTYKLNEAGRPTDDRVWDVPPSTVDALYLRSTNSLIIPAAIIQAPFFDLAADPSVNFGSIGVVVGHELTHGFDELGSRFDGNGNLREWQTADDHRRFAEKTDCEVAQYGNFGAMPDPGNLPQLKVNGRLTLAENTADNGGLRIAFQALTEALAAEGKTAQDPMDGYSVKQRFFLSFAQVWCQNQGARSARQSAKADPQSPGRGRVNGAIQNFDEFGKAFGCTIGAPMYPVNSCRVW